MLKKWFKGMCFSLEAKEKMRKQFLSKGLDRKMYLKK
ncbi:hypothetical protein NEOC65_002072 [Neochlamydia sp. AcF65]|nr:hypothetical protein [Neochlamydia sp. AcF65]MBS4169492.1 hypothetical protein [Neochlamydia sp. AcF95]